MTSVNASDEKWESTVEAPTRHRKPLAFDVEDAGCQANGPAMFGGTEDGLQAESMAARVKEVIEDAYRRGYAAGMKALEQFMADKEATAKLKTTERATEKPRSQSVPRTIQGWGVDVDKCQHWFVSILNTYEYGNVPLLQCSKCGYRKADL